MKKSPLVRIIILAGSLMLSWASAAMTEAWVQRYTAPGGDSVDQAYKVLRDPAGDFFVVGATADWFAVQGLLIIKYSGADGSVIWQRRYDMSLVVSRGLSAVVDGSGDLILTLGAYDYSTTKYSGADGAVLWERQYNGPAGGMDAPSAIAVDASGNVVVTGSSKIGIDDLSVDHTYPRDYYTAKYAAADGALLWERRYDGPANGDDHATAVGVDVNGNVVVTGRSYSVSSSFDYYTAKYAAADGALLWERRYDTPAGYHFAWALAVDVVGNVLVTGGSRVSFSFDYYTAKYAAADGALLWEKRYDSPGSRFDFAAAVAVDLSGDVVVTGSSHGDVGLMGVPNGDYYTARYAGATGALLWEKRYNSPANLGDVPVAIAVDASGNVVVTGSSDSPETYADYYTAKYAAATGALLWEKRYNGPTNVHDRARGMVLDVSGNVVVTGYSGNNGDFYTVKYSAASGAVLWEQRHNGPLNQDDMPSAVAMDASGNVVVTGASGDGSNDFDTYTAKYAVEDGALVWEKRYVGGRGGFQIAVDGTGDVVITGGGGYKAKYAGADGAVLWEKSSDVFIGDMALDPSGNVAVTGPVSTAKYAGATGALVWKKHHQRTPESQNRGLAVVVDASGNVVVTGSSQRADGQPDTDFYTAKYAAATGALLWERRYRSAANGDVVPTGLAVDANGNVVVTGYSCNSDTFWQHYTAKYAAADGALLWENRNRGPESRAHLITT